MLQLPGNRELAPVVTGNIGMQFDVCDPNDPIEEISRKSTVESGSLSPSAVRRQPAFHPARDRRLGEDDDDGRHIEIVE